MNKIKIIIIMLLVISFVTSSFYLYLEIKKDKEQEKIFENLIEIAEEIQEEHKKSEEDNINFENLYKINNDIIGWIKIDNTNINYPVMQTPNSPNYYLRKNFYKKYSIMGTPYLSEQCNLENSDNLIIYGHNISIKKMFGELENYKEEKYYKEHPIIKFYTKTEKADYEIISVFKTVAHSDFEYYNYIELKNESEFVTFITKCYELAFYNTNKKAEYPDKLITLSTCDYFQKNGRLVIVARKIK